MSEPSTSPPPPRRWSTRLRSILHLRSSRRRSSSSPPSPPSLTASETPASRRVSQRRRRTRRQPLADTRMFASSRAAAQASLRHRRQDLEQLDAQDTADLRASSGVGAVLTGMTNADSLEEPDIVAMFQRLFDEYDGSASSGDRHPASSVYLSRLPPHARHRVAMRGAPNAYLIAGPRRTARHSHLTTEMEREFRLRVRALRLSAGGGGATRYDYAASEDQIEALPTFVMEKGERRSVQQIFASMGAMDEWKVLPEEEDECGGLMTGLTECAICLSDFEPGDEITLLPCGHFFHLTGCVREWLRNHARTCPTCRADICSTTGSSDGLASQSATVGTTEEIS